MNVRRENQIAGMLLVGILMLPGGIFVMLGGMMFKAQLLMALGLVISVGGVFLAGWGVFFGHATNRSAGKSGVQWVNNCYVVGRFAIDQNGEMIFSEFEDNDLPRVKFFVRLKHPEGHDQEYECSRELISQIGEGMTGSAQVKGRWLGSFTPAPRPQPQ